MAASEEREVSKSIYKKFYIKVYENLLEWNIVYIFIKIINSQDLLYVRCMKYLVNRPIFHKFYVQNTIIKPCRMYFMCTFQLMTFVGFSAVFSNVFILTSNTHEQNTRSASHGLNKTILQYFKLWHKYCKIMGLFQKKFSNNNLCQLSYSQLKLLIKNHFFNFYNQECS